MSKPGKNARMLLAICSVIAVGFLFCAHVSHNPHPHKHIKSIADITDMAGGSSLAALTTGIYELPEPAHAHALPQRDDRVSPILAEECESPTTRPPPSQAFLRD